MAAGGPTPIREGKWDGRQLGRPFVLALDGTYWMFFSGSDLWGEWKIGAAVSADGVDWERLTDEPLIAPPGTRLGGGGWHSYENPWASLTPDGFRVVVGAQGDEPKSAIVSFASADGDSWSDPAVELVAPMSDEGILHLRDPWIVEDGGQESLFVTRVLTRPNDRETTIVRYLRTDAGGWAETSTTIVDVDGGEISHPAIVRTDEGWTLWCSSFFDGRFRILVAASSDLTTWTPTAEAVAGDPTTPYETQGVYAPMVVKDDEGFRMWHLTSSRTSDGMSVSVRLRRSDDGVSWSVVAERPVFTPRPGVAVRPW